MSYYTDCMAVIYTQHFPKPRQVERIVQAKQFIDTHACDDISLQDMAASACLSVFHFTRLFKRCYGYTPHQYLSSLRIGKAKQLLATGVTVTHTCFYTGYTSITSFTGLFKKMTGTTPLAYRQKKQFSRAPGIILSGTLPYKKHPKHENKTDQYYGRQPGQGTAVLYREAGFCKKD